VFGSLHHERTGRERGSRPPSGLDGGAKVFGASSNIHGPGLVLVHRRNPECGYRAKRYFEGHFFFFYLSPIHSSHLPVSLLVILFQFAEF
jgi:hypothetical protein